MDNLPLSSDDKKKLLTERTVQDFGDQWSRYRQNEGWYGSLGLFADITMPLLAPDDFAGKKVVDIGSGTGRIVNMLLQAGAAHVYAVEPSRGAFDSLERNIKQMDHAGRVTLFNVRGDCWRVPEHVDCVVSIGVIHHIPDPVPVIRRAFEALRPGGTIFIWVYGREGNELYLRIVEPLRKMTIRLPHWLLRCLVEVLYGCLCIYMAMGKLLRLPMLAYLRKVLWPMAPQTRRLAIYDQLNPAYAKYYTQDEGVQLLAKAGFGNIRTHHRHGYSWSVFGQKPVEK